MSMEDKLLFGEIISEIMNSAREKQSLAIFDLEYTPALFYILFNMLAQFSNNALVCKYL